MIKIGLDFRIADVPEDLDKCFEVRYKVFAEELNYLNPEEYSEKRESDELDSLETTTNFLALETGSGVPKAIATFRALEPNKDLAKKEKTFFGLPSEEYFDFSSVKKQKIKPIDFARSSVMEEHRKSPAMLNLWGISINYFLRKGYSHLFTIANAETDDIEEAKILHDIAGEKGFVHETIKTPVKNYPTRKEPCKNRLFNATVGKGKIELPYALNLYAKIGGRFTSEPIYYPDFRMCAFLITLDMKNMDKTIKALFERAWRKFDYAKHAASNT